MVAHIEVLPFDELLLDLLHPVHDLLAGQRSALAILVGHAVHEGVLLLVVHGPEKVVPQGEAEGPVAAELGLGPPLHAGRVLEDLHLGRFGISASASPDVLLVLVGRSLLLAVLDVRAAGAVLEAEAEGRREVERLELVHQVVARAHLEGFSDFVLLFGSQLVREVVEGGRGDAVLVLPVLATAFGHHCAGALVGEDGAGAPQVFFPAVGRSGRFLRLQLVPRLLFFVDGMDDFQDLRRDSAFREPRRRFPHGFCRQVLVSGVAQTLHVEDELDDHFPANRGLVKQGVDVRLAGLARLVGFQEHSHDVAQGFSRARELGLWRSLVAGCCRCHCCCCCCRRLCFVCLKLAKQVFPRQRKSESVASRSEAVAGELGLLVQRGALAAESRLHGHAYQSGHTGARTDHFHDRDLLLVQAFRRVAGPHVIAQAQRWKLSPPQVFQAVRADWQLALLAEGVLAGMLVGRGCAAVVFRTAQDAAEFRDREGPVLEVLHFAQLDVAGQDVVVLQVRLEAQELVQLLGGLRIGDELTPLDPGVLLRVGHTRVDAPAAEAYQGFHVVFAGGLGEASESTSVP